MLIMRLRRTGQFAVNHFPRISLSLSLSLTLLPHFYQSPLSPFLSFSLSPVRTCTSYSMHPLSLSIYLTPCQFHVFRIYTVRYFHLLLAIRFCCRFFSSLFSRKAISPLRISSTSLSLRAYISNFLFKVDR